MLLMTKKVGRISFSKLAYNVLRINARFNGVYTLLYLGF